MQIEFECTHCGKTLVIDGLAAGQTIVCAACGKLTDVPVPGAKIAGSKRIVIHVPRDLTAKTSPGDDNEPAAPVMASTEYLYYAEVLVGWICVVIGTTLALLLPRAWLTYLPFFAGAFLMAITLIVNKKTLHGIVLMFCVSVPMPLLMRENIWKHFGEQEPAAPEVQTIQFDTMGNTKLVPVSKREIVYVPAPASAVEAPARPAPVTAHAPRPVRRVPQPAEANDTSDSDRAANAAGTPDTMYRDLLNNKADVPPLVPEDQLAATPIGHGPDFHWQEDTPLEQMLPGDPAPVVEVPFVIYADQGDKENYSPTGRMGNKEALQFDDGWDLSPHSGKTCIYVRYAAPEDWVTVAWQNPGNNWGEVVGGYDLSKAKKLTFWAKGEDGGEKVEFSIGMEQSQTAVSRDSMRASTGIIRLRKDWRKYTLPIEEKDRSRLITGFLFRVEGQGKPVVFCLDDIQFE